MNALDHASFIARSIICYVYSMTLIEAYREQIKICIEKGIRYEAGHYETKIDFNGERFYVSPDGEDVVRNVFKITGCLKSRKIIKDGKVVKVIHFHKDRLPVYGSICNKKRVKGFLFKYMLFLRCDGIEDIDLIKLYVLHCLNYKFEFWRKKKTIVPGQGDEMVEEYKDWEQYEPEYEDVEKMINGLIESAKNNPLDDKTREQFLVRKRSVVNPESISGNTIRKKTNSEKHRDAHASQRKATDNRISVLYDPNLTNAENAVKAGVSLSRFKEWKAVNKEKLETTEGKIKRLYDPSLPLRKNAELIGCCVNSIQKYKERHRNVPEEEAQDDWTERILEEKPLLWEDVPDTKKKDNDEYEEIQQLLDDLE